jgi:hypothetical protein
MAKYYEKLASEYNYIMTTLYDTYMDIFPSVMPTAASEDDQSPKVSRHRLNTLGRFPILNKLRRRLFDVESADGVSNAQGSSKADLNRDKNVAMNSDDLELIEQMQQYTMELCNFLCTLGNDAYRIGTDHLDSLKLKLCSNFGSNLPEVEIICDLCENVSQLWLEVAARAVYHVAMLISDDIREQISSMLEAAISNDESSSNVVVDYDGIGQDDENVIHFISEEFPVLKARLVDYLFKKCALYCKQICK